MTDSVIYYQTDISNISPKSRSRPSSSSGSEEKSWEVEHPRVKEAAGAKAATDDAVNTARREERTADLIVFLLFYACKGSQ